MIFLIKKEFENKLKKLSKKYQLIFKDFENFRLNFDLRDGKDLGKGIYKFRIKNTSIPVGKRGGFRIILLVKILEDKALPFIIYSKTDLENITIKDIIDELRKYS